MERRRLSCSVLPVGSGGMYVESTNPRSVLDHRAHAEETQFPDRGNRHVTSSTAIGSTTVEGQQAARVSASSGGSAGHRYRSTVAGCATETARNGDRATGAISCACATRDRSCATSASSTTRATDERNHAARTSRTHATRYSGSSASARRTRCAAENSGSTTSASTGTYSAGLRNESAGTVG